MYSQCELATNVCESSLIVALSTVGALLEKWLLGQLYKETPPGNICTVSVSSQGVLCESSLIVTMSAVRALVER